jgi:hypothetical protein
LRDFLEMARNKLSCEKKTLCVLLWQWDCYKSVARIRLVKTKNTNVRVNVNCKLCTSAIAFYY